MILGSRQNTATPFKTPKHHLSSAPHSGMPNVAGSPPPPLADSRAFTAPKARCILPTVVGSPLTPATTTGKLETRLLLPGKCVPRDLFLLYDVLEVVEEDIEIWVFSTDR
ncbi:uncharacterized protein LOC131333610 [Rhododendron vialii]|uniref:uncharacterized protein LOC131333610 n=1 Tax=Rhododendron vialii TaxID=182163 RepID=UPI00265DB41A|nr:uncharacterized protein LOC131333610 [Rhododendron vialii]